MSEVEGRAILEVFNPDIDKDDIEMDEEQITKK
jgi:hypothetical protein